MKKTNLKKMLDFIVKYKKYYIYICCLFVILIIHFYNFSISANRDFSVVHFKSSYNNQDNVEEILYYDQIVLQEFVASTNNLYKVKIYLNGIENFQISNSAYDEAYLLISIEDENHNVIEQHKYDKIFYDQEGAFTFQFKPITESKNNKYYLRIQSYHQSNLLFPHVENNDTVSVHNDNKLWIDDEIMDGHLMFTTVYKENNTDLILFSVLTILIVGIFLGALYLIKKHKLSIEKQYLILAFIVSLCMIFVFPPFAGHDERGHFARVYELSNGNMVTDMTNNWLYTEIPNYQIGFTQYSQIPLIINQNELPMDVEMQYASVYSPMSYVPQVVGLKIAEIFTSESFYWNYFIRIAEALTCIIITYFAIKIIPFGKKILFVIGVLPTYIQATSLISADALLVSSSLLLIAKVLQLACSSSKVKNSEYLLLGILSTVLAISKLVYIPLCFVLLYLAYKRRETLKPIIVILLISLMAVFLWNLIAMQNLMSGQGGNTAYYIKEILTNPFHFVQITLYSFVNQIGNYVNDLFGGLNTWHDNVIFDSTILPVAFCMIFLYVLDDPKMEFNIKEKIGLGIIVLGTWLLISTSLYISCTPVNHDQIVGIQGRYFLPLLFPIYLLLPKMKKKKQLDLSVFLIIFYVAYFLKAIILYI